MSKILRCLVYITILSFPLLINAQEIPDDGDYDFAGAILDGDGPNFKTLDGFFIISGHNGSGTSSGNISADGFGAFINDGSTTSSGTSYIEVSVNGGGSFQVTNAVIGDYNESFVGTDNNFTNVYAVGLVDGVQVAITPAHNSPTYQANYFLNFSDFAGKTINAFRVYYTWGPGTSQAAFNLENISIAGASDEPPPAAAPTVATTAATSVTTTTATVNASVNDNGAATTAQFRLHTNENTVSNGSGGDVKTATPSVSAGAGSTAVSYNYTTLSPGNTYYYRAEATNSAGTTNGTVLHFTTLPTPPTLSAATSISSTGFTINWGESAAWLVNGYRLDVATDAGFTDILSSYNDLYISDKTTVSQALTGLSPGTQYWYRLRAENDGGVSTNSGSGSQTTSFPPIAGFGNALDFDGTNDHVNIPDHASLKPTGGITLGAWVNTRGSGNFQFIIGKEGIAEDQWHYLLSLNNARHIHGRFYVNSAGNKWHDYTTAAVIPLNTWTHVATTYDNSSVKVYINGILSQTFIWNEPLSPGVGSTPLTIGIRGDGQYPFNGRIDEPQVWNRALSDSEIQASMFRNTVTTGLVGYWKFNESSGTSIEDSSPIGNNGTMMNMDDSDHIASTISDFTVASGATHTGILAGTDMSGNALTWSIVGNGSKGTATITNASTGAFSYTPLPNASGSDSFTFKVNNGLGDSNTATVNLTIQPGPVAGFKNALSFNGTTDRVTAIAAPGNLGTGDFAITAWFKTTGSGAIISNRTEPSNNDNFFTLAVSSGKIWVEFDGGASGPGDYHSRETANLGLSDNNWHHVVVQRSGTAYIIFVDGVERLNSTIAGTLDLTSGNNLIIGGRYNGATFTQPFPGQLDEISVWNRALTPTEGVTSMYKTFNGNESGLVGLWKFNEGSGTTVYDNTSNGYNGTITGASYVTSTIRDFPTDEDVVYSGILPGSKIDGSALTYSVVANGAKGSISITNAATGAFTYTPALNENGSDSFTFKVNDGSNDSDPAAVNVSITAVNDAPTLTATGATPTFTEGGSAVSLFSGASVSTVEAGQQIIKLTLTVSSINDGSNELLHVDGTDIGLTNGSGTTPTNGLNYNVAIGGGTATLTLEKPAGISAAATATVVNGLTYRNTSATPSGTSRTVTLTSIQDDGGTANGGVDNNTSLSIAATVTISISPRITGVTSSTDNGIYKIGDPISIQVTFDKDVAVTGTPTLALNSGGTASYQSVSSNTLTFAYTVAAGESAPDLDYSAISSLSLSGGTIKDESESDAILTLPAPGASGSLGANKGLVIDGVAPTVTAANISISGGTGTSGAYKVGDIVTASWDNRLAGDNNSDIAAVTVDFSPFGGGTAVAAANSSGTWSASYTIIAGLIDGTNINVSVTATDNAGNATTTADDTNVTVDNIAPTVTAANISISGGTGTSGTYKIGDIVTASWDNRVAGDNNSDIAAVTVDFSPFGGGTAVAAANSSGTWSASYTIIAGLIDGTNINVSVTATDNAGNATTTADDTNVTVDNIAPTVTAANISISGGTGTSGAYKIGDIVTASWDNRVAGDNNSDVISGVTINFSPFGGGTAVAAANSGNTWTASYTIIAGLIDGTNINVSVTATDNAGNPTTTADDTNATVDNIRPTASNVSIISNNTNTTLAKSGEVVTITFTSSEAVNTPSVSIGGLAATVTNSSGNNWVASRTMTLTDTEGVIAFSIGFNDIAGNPGTAVTATDDASDVTFDRTAPATPLTLAVISGDTENTLNWDANSEDDLASYKLYSGTTSNPTVLLQTITAGTLSYTHTGLINGTTYYYRISTTDATGNESDKSADADAVPKAAQSITFNTLADVTYGTADFDPGATASSGLSISYTSSNPSVATIVAEKVHILGTGTTTITASQAGNSIYLLASDETQDLIVLKKDISVSLNAAPAISKVYNGTNAAALATGNYSLNGIETGDAVTVSATASYDDKNAGTGKAVTVTGFVLAGADKDNYNLTTASAATTGDIIQKNMTISLNAAPAISKVYNGTNAAALATGNYSLNGIETGDAVTVSGTASYDNKNAGSGKTVTVNSFILAGADKDNYDLTTTSATTTGDITQKNLTVLLNATPAISKIYDGTDAAALAAGNYSLSGIETGDAVAVSGTASYNDKNAGTGKIITVNSFVLSNAQKDNYSVSTVSATTTGAITAKPLTASLEGTVIKPYDGNVTASLSSVNYGDLTGIIGSDDVSYNKPGSGTYNDKTAATGKTIAVAGLTLSGTDAGNYTFASALSGSIGMITAKPLTVSLTGNVTKIYDGNTAAVLTASNYLLAGIVSGDAVSLNNPASGSYSNESAGTGKTVIVSSLSLTGDDAINYILASASVNAAVGTITPKALTITADNKTRVQGLTNPTFTASYSGFVNGETNTVLVIQPAFSTTADPSSPQGDYPIVASGAAAANYTINYIDGTLTVTPGQPTSLSLTAVTLPENQPAGTLAGTFSSTSDDPGAIFTYSLVPGPGSIDNSLFTISGNQLFTTSTFDYESKAAFSVLVRTTSQYGLYLDQQFTIALADVNETPTLAAIANQILCITSANQTIALSGITAGPETGQSASLSVSSGNPAMFTSLAIGPVTGGSASLIYQLAPDALGTATITVTVNDNGDTSNGGIGSFSRTFTITSNALPVGSVNSDIGNEINKGLSAQLTASGGTLYTWSNAPGIVSGQNSAILTVRPEVTTTYTVTIENASGCTTVQSITINVLDNIIAVEANNMMSPDGDGINDNLIIQNLDMHPNNTVRIYDRAGRLLFEKKNYTNEWDGTFQGSPLAEDTYFYIVDFGPAKRQLKGFVTIVRKNEE